MTMNCGRGKMSHSFPTMLCDGKIDISVENKQAKQKQPRDEQKLEETFPGCAMGNKHCQKIAY